MKTGFDSLFDFLTDVFVGLISIIIFNFIFNTQYNYMVFIYAFIGIVIYNMIKSSGIFDDYDSYDETK